MTCNREASADEQPSLRRVMAHIEALQPILAAASTLIGKDGI